MTTKIDSVAARKKLPLAREPYWHRVSKGQYLGFRKMSSATGGTWVARSYDPYKREQRYRKLGDFGELLEGERFDAAMEEASKWFKHLGLGGDPGLPTIRRICANYVEHLRAADRISAADDAQRRFDRYVLDDPAFAALDGNRLTVEHIRNWKNKVKVMPVVQPRRSGGKSRTKRKVVPIQPGTAVPEAEQSVTPKLRTAVTLNRDITPFRAALNLAFKQRLLASSHAWATVLEPTEAEERRRDLYLTRDQRRELVNAAESDVGLFLWGMCVLPFRPGALSCLTVGDYDRTRRVLRIGMDKNGKGRYLSLPEETAVVFDIASKDKLPGAPLFSRTGGKQWNKDSWTGPVKETAMRTNWDDVDDEKERARLSAATAYTLRHSVITDLVHDGLDLLTVAQLAGTSVRMIEKYYGHLRGEVAARSLAKLAG